MKHVEVRVDGKRFAELKSDHLRLKNYDAKAIPLAPNCTVQAVQHCQIAVKPACDARLSNLNAQLET